MGLAIDDRWVWDLWVADTGGDYHLFYLQAPRSLGDPELRHHHATVGHAVSSDLTNWRVLPDALAPGPPGEWDDLATWTGSVVRVDGRWHMFYTGARIEDDRVVQRIGVAISDDLISWTKVDGPIIEADSRWYERLDDGSWYEEAWRDPWVVVDSRGVAHALITARSRSGPPDGRGVIGHARSTDLASWEVGPPLSAPGEFGHLEVPQVAQVDGAHLLVFSSDSRNVSRARQARLGGHPPDATYMTRAESPLGPFPIDDAKPALPPEFYGGRLVQSRDGGWVWLAFVGEDDDGVFRGEIGDPVPFAPPS